VKIVIKREKTTRGRAKSYLGGSFQGRERKLTGRGGGHRKIKLWRWFGMKKLGPLKSKKVWG